MYCIDTLQNVVKRCFIKLKCACCSVHTSAQRLATLLSYNRVNSMSYPLCWTVLLHGSIKRSFPTLPPLNPDPFVHNVVPVWTRKEGLGVEWVAPSFVSYASSCLFTSIQCPADPQDNHPTFFSLWPRRQIWEMCFLEQQMSLCWCHHRRVVWVDNPAVMCVSCGVLWAGELEAVGWSSLCPRQLHLWTP